MKKDRILFILAFTIAVFGMESKVTAQSHTGLSSTTKPVVPGSHPVQMNKDTSSEQQIKRFPQMWISGGLVGFRNLKGYGFSATFARKNHSILTGRYLIGNETFAVQSLTHNGLAGNSKFQELALLYGVMTDGRFGQASIAAGLGWTFESGDPSHPGLAIESNLSLTLLPFGIGLKGFAHFSKPSFLGAGIYMHFGKL